MNSKGIKGKVKGSPPAPPPKPKHLTLNKRTDNKPTFPRRKRYSWYKPADTIVDKRIKTERRRTQLLDQYSEAEEGNISIGEWMALLKERDQLLKESLRQENEQAKLKFIGELNDLLSDVPDFSPEDDIDIAKSVTILRQNIRTYCSHRNITPPAPNKETTTDKENTPHESPPKPPVPKTKPKVARMSTTPPKLVQTARVHEHVHVTGTKHQPLSIATVRPLPASSLSHDIISEEQLKPQFQSGNPQSQSVRPQTQSGRLQSQSGKLQSQPSNVVPVLPAVVPPPPPPPVLPCSTITEESLPQPDSNCSSMSLQEEITSHKKGALRHVSGPKTPGGTPMRSMDNTDLLQQALMKKFRSIHIHSTPKRNGLMDSNSIEVSSAWSEWGASVDNIHQYASDPDFSRDMTTPLPNSSARSAADFGSTFSSPSLDS